MRLLKLLFAMIFIGIIKCKVEASVVEVDAVLDRCCKLGQKLSSKSCKTLGKIPFKFDQSFHTLCHATVQLCCQKSRQNIDCNDGINGAKTTGKCDIDDRSETFKLCCLSCAVGEEIAKANGKCTNNIMPSDLEKVQSECCESFQQGFGITSEAKSPIIETDYSVDDNDDEIDGPIEAALCNENHGCHHDCEIRKDRAFCLCKEGFKLSSDGRRCILVEPCEKGYEFNDVTDKCEDIDECAVSTSNRCHIIDRCINIPGAYNCKPKICSIGYVLNHQTGNCDDIDECLKKPCARNQKCVNFPGSYYCDCAYGYRKDVYSKKDCRDINECVEHPGICEQSCMNTVGSYRCGCKNGFRISQDNRTCSDVDECEEKYSSLLCPTPAQCKNTLGSFRCSCPSGLRLISGRYCDDIDECKENANICSRNRGTCLNTRGSYKCNVKPPCEKGYRRKRHGACHLMNRLLCDDENDQSDSDEIQKPCKVPLFYDYTFGTVIANRSVPTGGQRLYRYRIPENKSFETFLKDFKVNYAANGVQIADNSFFHFEKISNEVFVQLVKPIDGPQEIEIDLWVHFYGKGTQDEMISGQRMVIFVSEYS